MTASATHTGALTRDPARPLVLVVAHAAGDNIGGGERSLLEILEHMGAAGLDTVVVVPPQPGLAYLAELAARTTEVVELPVPRRCPPEGPAEEVVEQYAELIRAIGASAVHCNTIVPREPLAAARRVGVPAVVHAREVPHDDPELQEWLGGASADVITQSVVDDADYVIANSRFTAEHYPLSGRTAVVSPAADAALAQLDVSSTLPLRACLIGAPTEKKGARDLVRVAELLAHRTDLTLAVIGARSPLADELAAAGCPANMRLLGPTATPLEAVAQTDILLSLSHCAEGFGRTILEGMTAARPVVAYRSGAIEELVVDQVTGFLVERGDVDGVASLLERLADDPKLSARLGDAGRQRALELFAPDRAAEALARAYGAILPAADVVDAAANDVSIPIPFSNRTHHTHPFYIGSRARFATCTSVRFISDTRLVTASLLGSALHVVAFDPHSGTGRIVSTTDAVDTQGLVTLDLLDFDGVDRVATANCEHQTVSVFRLRGDALHFESSVGIPVDHAGFCHGVSFVPGQPDVVCVSTNTGGREALLLSLRTGAAVGSFHDPGWVSKATAFAGETRMLALEMTQPVGQDPRTPHAAQVSLVNLDGMSVLDQLTLPERTLDGATARGELLMVASQSHDSVLAFSTEGDRLELTDELPGFSFPHDVAISPDGRWLAVACYGTGDVRLRRLPDHLVRPAGSAERPRPGWRQRLRLARA